MMPTQTTDNSYLEKLKDPRWQRKRLEIFQRDDWTCQKCFDTKKTLNVHHKLYLPKTEPWDYPDDLLITLCQDCHEDEGKSGRIDQSLLIALHSKFTTEEISEIAIGFYTMELPLASENFGYVIGWSLTDTSTQNFITARYSAFMRLQLGLKIDG